MPGIPMSDTTPLTAIDRLQGQDVTGPVVLTEFSRTLGKAIKKDRSERWKQKLREELVLEHITGQTRKAAPARFSLRKLFGLR